MVYTVTVESSMFNQEYIKWKFSIFLETHALTKSTVGVYHVLYHILKSIEEKLWPWTVALPFQPQHTTRRRSDLVRWTRKTTTPVSLASRRITPHHAWRHDARDSSVLALCCCEATPRCSGGWVSFGNHISTSTSSRVHTLHPWVWVRRRGRRREVNI